MKCKIVMDRAKKFNWTIDFKQKKHSYIEKELRRIFKLMHESTGYHPNIIFLPGKKP